MLLAEFPCPGSLRCWPCLPNNSVCSIPRFVASKSSPSPFLVPSALSLKHLSFHKQTSLCSQCWGWLGLLVRTALWKCLLALQVGILGKWGCCQLAVLLSHPSSVAADNLVHPLQHSLLPTCISASPAAPVERRKSSILFLLSKMVICALNSESRVLVVACDCM